MERFITIEVPDELAKLLIADGLASVVDFRRSPTWKLLADFAGGAATTVSLLQAPETVSYLAESCRTMADRWHKRKGKEAHLLHLEAIGPRGQIRISLDATTSVGEIEHLLRQTIFEDSPRD